MSDLTETDSSEDLADDLTESAAQPEFSQPKVRTSRLGGLALLLALAALVLSGWQWWQQRQLALPVDLQQQLTGLQTEMSRQQQTLLSQQQELADYQASATAEAAKQPTGGTVTRLQSNVRGLQRKDNELSQSLDSLQAQGNAVNLAVQGLQERQAALESAVAGIADMRLGNDRQLALSEVEYLLRLGNERLQLFGDVAAAKKTLNLADRQLAALDDPIYTAVRQRLRDDQAKLLGLQMPDVIDLLNRLSALEQQVPEWPLQARERGGSDTVSGTQEDAGLWQRTKNSLSGLVKVRRTLPDEQQSHLTLGDIEMLQARQQELLQVARFALRQKDAAAYRDSLNSAIQLLDQYYQSDNSVISGVRNQLKDLRDVDFTPQLPDITAAWRQLQALRIEAPTQLPAMPRQTRPSRRQPDNESTTELPLEDSAAKNQSDAVVDDASDAGGPSDDGDAL